MLPEPEPLAYRVVMNGGAVRFGAFEFNPDTGELHRDGRPVKLQAQPAKLLAALVAKPGEVVSRESLQRELWGTDTHVDFERGLNFCVAQVRTALRDNADTPLYIATVPKQGYRFIAPVQTAGVAPAALADRTDREADALPPRRRAPWLGIAAAVAVLLVLGATTWPRDRAPVSTVIVVPFYNETGNAELDVVARAIGDATVARLAAPERIGTLSVIGNAAALRNPFAKTDVQQIARELNAQWVVIGQLKTDGQSMRVIGHLIRTDDMKHVWANTYDEQTFALDAQARTAESIAAAVSQALASN